jgi:hypothetical protein
VVTTHSPDILSYVPRPCLRLVVRKADAVAILESPDLDQLEMALGVETPTKAIIVVEDRCAREVTKELLRIFRPDVASRVKVIDTGGESALTSALEKFPSCSPTIEVVGVYDGDQREARDEDRSKGGKPKIGQHFIEFLPGNVSPDAWLRAKCKSQDEQMANALNMERSRVAAILASCEGMNHHDWLEELARRLQVSYDVIVAVLLRIILAEPEDEAECESAANKIAQRAIGEPDLNLQKMQVAEGAVDRARDGCCE